MEGTITLHKWGTGVGVRIPENVLNILNMHDGDKFTYEVTRDTIILRPIRRRKSTKEMFEEFYHKPFDEINESDLGDESEIDWGEDVGTEENRYKQG